MKKIILALAILISASAFAQDGAILDKIASAGSLCKSVSGPFVETRVSSAGKTSATLKGDLTFTAPDVFSMMYSEPEGDCFMISGDVMKSSIAGTETVYDLRKNVMMRSLSHILLYSFSGRINDLISELGADCKVETSGDGYQVTLSAKVKSTRGYSSVQIFYNASCKLQKMVMAEWSGRSTTYELAK